MNFWKKYINKYWKLFFTAVFFLTIEAGCDLMQPTIMSKIVDTGIYNRNMGYVINMGMLMLLITAVGAVSATSRNIISSNVSQKFGSELRLDLYKKILSFSYENVDQFETASLVTRLTNDVTQFQNFVNGLMRIFVKAPLLCIGSIIMASRLNPKMSVIILIIVPIVGILISINMKIGYPFFSRVQGALDKVNGVLREYLSGVRVVKAFNRFAYETVRFDDSNKNLSNQSVRAMRVMAVFSPAIALTVNLGIVLVLWIGGLRVNDGDMHVGQIIAFINYMTQILFSLMMISNVFTMFVRAKASAERIGDVFKTGNTIDTPVKSKRTPRQDGDIEFLNVSFSYGNSNEPALKDISFKCAKGETLGIIGSTGAGKSSLVNLIPRFYDVNSGKVEVDGVDVREIDLKELRERIAVVPQKTVLFTGTIMDNIKWGKEDAGLEEIQKAAQAAQAHDFIMSFPEEYNTMLGQGGVNLSGGQKQRISIARALIKKPEILILDDCTSAVDMATENEIKKSLREFSKDLTCIVIAQRITSVMNADKIIVLDNGSIAGEGSHRVLMETCGVYQDIFHSQLGKELA